MVFRFEVLLETEQWTGFLNKKNYQPRYFVLFTNSMFALQSCPNIMKNDSFKQFKQFLL